MPELSAPTLPVRVWDLPTRVFHWALALLVVAAIVSAEIGGNWMAWHLRCGYGVISLLAFRIVWGLAGGHWSRFAQFPPSPARALRYLQGRSLPGEATGAGHNPLGAFSVWAMFGLLLLQVASGLFADDEIATVGPLNKFVSGKLAGWASFWHADIGGTAVMVLIGLHLAAIVFYVRWRHQDLVRPMLQGDAQLPAGTPASRDSGGTRALALLVWALCMAAVLAALRWLEA